MINRASVTTAFLTSTVPHTRFMTEVERIAHRPSEAIARSHSAWVGEKTFGIYRQSQLINFVRGNTA